MKKRILLMLVCLLMLSVAACLFAACSGVPNVNDILDSIQGGGDENKNEDSENPDTENGGDENKNEGSENPDTENGGDENQNVGSEGLKYSLSNGYYAVSGIGSCKQTDIVIPSEYKGRPVTYINNEAFKGCTGLTSITIGNNVKAIGNSAFYDCTELTTVTLPNSVKTIDSSAFMNCTNLSSVTIGNSVEAIGSYAFYGCTALTSVTIPNSVKTIDSSTFSNCTNLSSVTIGNSVEAIGSYAFYGCTALTSVTIPNSVTSIGWDVFSGCIKIVEIVNNSSLTITITTLNDLNVLEVHSGESKLVNINGYLFYSYEKNSTKYNYLVDYIGTDTALTLPDNYNGQSYMIRNYAFSDCTNLSSVTIPNSVTSIDNSAFVGCTKLVEIINKSSLNINTKSYGLNALEVHSGESKLVNINGYLFYSYEKNSIKYNYLVNYIGTDTALTLPDNYNGQSYSIYKNAFRDCTNISSVTIPNSVTIIDNYAFYGCTDLESVTIGNSVTTIGGSAFEFCTSLTTVTIPDSVTTIGGYAFRGCTNLTSVTIGNNVKTIGKSAFVGCTNLANVTIPNSVTRIGDSAFENCTNLNIINYRGTEAQWNDISKSVSWDKATGYYTINYEYTGE